MKVISTGTAWLPNPKEMQAWRGSLERFAASIKGASLVVAEQSGHMIPFSQPDLLISVIVEVVRSANSKAKSGPPVSSRG